MAIPSNHLPLDIRGTAYSLSHLDTFGLAMKGKGYEPGTDLAVLVKFSNHVFTKRTKYGDPYDVLDHHGTKRSFDPARYDMSKRLPGIIRQALTEDAWSFVSKSFGGSENLMLVELESDQIWSVVFCFQPLAKGVVMEILSTHPRMVSGNKKRNRLSYFARKCMFGQHRVPKN